MTYLASTTTATNPTFMSQYGPVLAAGVALVGVLITLLVNGRRDQARYRSQREDDEARYRRQREDDEARYRSQREDDYRRDQRIAIADIAVAGQDFRRECGALVNRDHWREHRDAAEAAMAALVNKLTVARLLVHDLILQGALDGLYIAWQAVGAAVDEVDNAFSNQKFGRQEAVESLEQALLLFDSETDVLHTAALERLKPPDVEIE